MTESINAAGSVKAALQETANEVTQSIRQTTSEVKERIHTAVTEEVKKSTYELNSAVDKVTSSLKETLRLYAQEASWQFWKTMLSSVICGAVISVMVLIVFAKIMPKPTLPISDEKLGQLHLGQSLAAIWPKLTKVEQARLRKLADDADYVTQD